MGNFIAVAIIVYVLATIVWAINKINTRRQKEETERQKEETEELAHKMMDGFDFKKEKGEIKSIHSQLNLSEETSRDLKKEKERKRLLSYNNLHKCPKCGGMLVKRGGKFGQFWGCNRYPRCRYTRKIKV